MASRRRQFRETEVLEVLILQGAIIPCHRCRVAFTAEDVRARNIEKEHLHERELGGADEPENCRFSHKSRPCHAQVTHGTKATWAGSSRHRIAKATDPDRIDKFKVRKRALDADRVGLPTGRCRKCGEYPDECRCEAPVRRTSFGGRR